MPPLQTLAVTATLLAASSLFMTFAWHGHLKHLAASPWYVAALARWNCVWASLCVVGAVHFIFQG